MTIEDLQKQLEQAIDDENFEIAASIRDKIEHLEKEQEINKVREIQEEKDLLQKERDDLFQRLQRVSAEFDNYQKRVKRDSEVLKRDAIKPIIASLLPVVDNLDYTLQSVQSLYDGFQLLKSSFLETLTKHGVSRIEPKPFSKFDTAEHQAIATNIRDDVDSEVVELCHRAGYKLGAMVIRPAEVVVAQPPGS